MDKIKFQIPCLQAGDSTQNFRRLSGFLFILFPILVQIPFGMLVAQFDYPEILRESPAAILTRFAQGGSALISVWYAYALSIGVFIAAVMAYDRSLKAPFLINRIGLASAAIQLVALLRWTFLVPFLARDYANTTDTVARQSIETLFSIQHNFLGIGLGEHVGQLTMAVWTVLVVHQSRQSVLLRSLGYLSALLLTVGLSEHLAVVFGFDAGIFAQGAMIGFILWSVWLMGFGITLLRHSPPIPVDVSAEAAHSKIEIGFHTSN